MTNDIHWSLFSYTVIIIIIIILLTFLLTLFLPSIPPGLVKEYQLRLGRQRQVWLIPLVDERWVCR